MKKTILDKRREEQEKEPLSLRVTRGVIILVCIIIAKVIAYKYGALIVVIASAIVAALLYLATLLDKTKGPSMLRMWALGAACVTGIYGAYILHYLFLS